MLRGHLDKESIVGDIFIADLAGLNVGWQSRRGEHFEGCTFVFQVIANV